MQSLSTDYTEGAESWLNLTTLHICARYNICSSPFIQLTYRFAQPHIALFHCSQFEGRPCVQMVPITPTAVVSGNVQTQRMRIMTNGVYEYENMLMQENS